jgi:hypothetical protein
MNEVTITFPPSEVDAGAITPRLSKLVKATIELQSGSGVKQIPVIGSAITDGRLNISFASEAVLVMLTAMGSKELIATAGRALGKELETALTLSEKEQSLRKSVALPTADDWKLFIKDDSLIDQLNAALVESLSEVKASQSITFGAIEKIVYGRLNAIAKDYPEAGLSDSEASQTVARFFAVNYSPKLYDFLRHVSISQPDIEDSLNMSNA